MLTKVCRRLELNKNVNNDNSSKIIKSLTFQFTIFTFKYFIQNNDS